MCPKIQNALPKFDSPCISNVSRPTEVQSYFWMTGEKVGLGRRGALWTAAKVQHKTVVRFPSYSGKATSASCLPGWNGRQQFGGRFRKVSGKFQGSLLRTNLEFAVQHRQVGWMALKSGETGSGKSGRLYFGATEGGSSSCITVFIFLT